VATIPSSLYHVLLACKPLLFNVTGLKRVPNRTQYDRLRRLIAFPKADNSPLVLFQSRRRAAARILRVTS
jgi:hypothetical protein